MPDQVPHAIELAGSPCARRQEAKASSQLLAAAYAPCPGEPTNAAAEENAQNQSNDSLAVAQWRFHAP